MPRKLTKEEFIKRSKELYGENTYDYYDVDYVNSYTKVKIYCNRCGEIFEKEPRDFLSGKTKGCQKCSHKELGEKLSLDQEEWIKRAEEKFGNICDYSETNYINDHHKVTIFCKVHQGYFSQRPSTHLRSKYGCPICAKKLAAEGFKSNTEEFIKRATEVHGGLYDYSKVEYVTNQTPVLILDLETSEEFWQTPNSHLSGAGNPNRYGSNGEFNIQRWLQKNNYDFEREYVLSGEIQGRNSDLVKIDFRLFIDDQEYWIEFNGIQHYEPNIDFYKFITHTSDIELQQIEYQKQITRDNNVREYCKNNSINLIEIPYTYDTYEKLDLLLTDIFINKIK